MLTRPELTLTLTEDVLTGPTRVPVSRSPAQGGAAVLRPGRRGGPGQAAQRGGGVVGSVEPGGVPAVLPPVECGRLAGPLTGRQVVVEGGGPPHTAGVVVVEITPATVAGLTVLRPGLVQRGHGVLGGAALAARLLQLHEAPVGQHPLSVGAGTAGGQILQPGQQHLGAPVSAAQLAAVDQSGRLAGLLSHSDVAHREGRVDRLAHQLLLPPVPVDHHQQEEDDDGHDAGHDAGGDVDVVGGVGPVRVPTVDAVKQLLDVRVVAEPDDLDQLLGVTVHLLLLQDWGSSGWLAGYVDLHNVAELASVVEVVVGQDCTVELRVPVVRGEAAALPGSVVSRGHFSTERDITSELVSVLDTLDLVPGSCKYQHFNARLQH